MTATARTVPDPRTEPTISVARAASLVGLSKRSGYRACERGEWPSLRVGSRVVVPTARLLRQLQLLDEETA